MADIARLGVVVDPSGAVAGARQVNRQFDRMSSRALLMTKTTGGALNRLKLNIFSVRGAMTLLLSSILAKGIISDIAEFGQGIADLSAITGATGKDLKFFSDAARELGAVTTLSATQAAEAFKLIASAKPDLLENSAALKEVTTQAIVLAEAAGITLPQAAKALGLSLNQFGVDADQTARFINVLAAGAKFGASEISETADAIKDSGAVAKLAGISFEELNAAIQIVAAGGIKAGEAGTALRNVFLRLEQQSNDGLKPSLVGLEQALLRVKDLNLDVTGATELFGKTSLAAGAILSANADKFGNLEEKITGTTVAAEQQAIRTNTLSADWLKLKSAVTEFNLVIGDSTSGPLRGFTQGLTRLTIQMGKTLTNVALLQDIDLGLDEQTAKVAKLSLAMEVFRDNSVDVFGSLGDTLGSIFTDFDIFIIFLAQQIPTAFAGFSLAAGKAINAVAFTWKLNTAVMGTAWNNSLDFMSESLADFVASNDTFVSPLGPLIKAQKLLSDTSLEDQLRNFKTIEQINLKEVIPIIEQYKDINESLSKNYAITIDGIEKKFSGLVDAQLEARYGLEDLLKTASTTPTPSKKLEVDVPGFVKDLLEDDGLSDKERVELAQTALREQSALEAEGEAVRKLFRTETEIFNETIVRYKELLNDGVLSADSFARAEMELRNELDGTNDKIALGARLVEELRTEEEIYIETVEELDKLLNDGIITWETYNRATEQAAVDFRNAKEGARDLGDEFTELRRAIDGWGRDFARTMLDSSRSFGDFIDGVLQKFGEIAFQASIDPLFNVFGSFLDNIFSGGDIDLPTVSGTQSTVASETEGGFFDGFFDFLPFFAHGGQFKVGGAGGTDSQIVGFHATPGETVTVSTPGQMGSGGNTFNQVFYQPTIKADDTQSGLELLVKHKDVIVALVAQSRRKSAGRVNL